jgi:hypothetical protein
MRTTNLMPSLPNTEVNMKVGFNTNVKIGVNLGKQGGGGGSG